MVYGICAQQYAIKTIRTLEYEFYISTNTNLGGKKYTRPWKMRIDCLHT
jgi:hypothetical protein